MTCVLAYVIFFVYFCSRKGFMKELPTYTPDFEEYIHQGEPDKKERAQIWRTAIGLQQVKTIVCFEAETNYPQNRCQ